MTRRLFRIAGAIAAGLLAVGVIALAGPTVIWELIRGTALGTLVGAAGIAAIGAVCRGARLSFVLPPQILGIAQATSVGVAAQAAALFIPARIGELALPWLLRRQCKVPFPSGIGTLIATRSLDLAALSVWGGVALILLDHTNPLLWICAIVLLLPALLIQPIFRVLDRCSVRLLGHRGARGRWWAHRIRSVRLSLDSVSRSRGRFTIAAVSSVLMWGSVWLYTWLLVQGIGYQWKFSVVFTGACGAAAANIIPVSLIANVGTLEAGWTAVLVTLGIHVQDAAASGVAIHFWGLVFAAIFGSLGWAAVQLHGSETES